MHLLSLVVTNDIFFLLMHEWVFVVDYKLSVLLGYVFCIYYNLKRRVVLRLIFQQRNEHNSTESTLNERIRTEWKHLRITGGIKDCVSLYCSGCTPVSIHRHEPTTERHGGFDLLRFRPGPVHPSLDDLVVPGSPRSAISIPNLVRTPDRHSPLQLRTPELKRSASLSLPVTWITGARHCTRRETRALLGLLTLR